MFLQFLYTTQSAIAPPRCYDHCLDRIAKGIHRLSLLTSKSVGFHR